MAENFIFSYIGVSMFTFPKHNFDPFYIIGAFIAIFLGRFLNVYPLSAVLNLGRTVSILMSCSLSSWFVTKVRISGSIQHTMMFAGLRGAIAFALAIRNTVSLLLLWFMLNLLVHISYSKVTESRQMILSTAILIVIITVIVNGGSTMTVLTWLGVPMGVLEDPGEQDPIVNSPLHGYQTVEEEGTTSTRPPLPG